MLNWFKPQYCTCKITDGVKRKNALYNPKTPSLIIWTASRAWKLPLSVAATIAKTLRTSIE